MTETVRTVSDSPWRYDLCDVVTGRVYGSLPLSVDSMSDALSDVSNSSITASLDLRPTDVRLLRPLGMTGAARTVLVVNRDDRPLAAYLVKSGSRDGQGHLSVGGPAIGAALTRREVWDDITWKSVDAFTVARDLVKYAQGHSTSRKVTLGAGLTVAIPSANLDLGITTTSGSSGYKISKQVAGSDGRTVAELLDDLAELDPGIDYAFDVEWSVAKGRYVFPLRLGYPTLGRTFEQTGLQFTFNAVNGNVLSYALSEDGDVPTVTRAAGQGTGGAAGSTYGQVFSGVAVASDALAAGFPVVMETVQQTTDADTANLDAYAAASLSLTGTRTSLSFTVKGDAWPVLGQWNRGDEALVTILDPYAGTPDDPDAGRLEVVARLVGWTLHPDVPSYELQIEVSR